MESAIRNPHSAIRVVFATTVFDDVATGPGVFARYLWRALKEDGEIEFHLVCPSARLACPRLHAAGGAGSVYTRVADKAREVAQTLANSAPAQSAGCQPAGLSRGWPILHVNAAHAAGGLLDYAGPWIVQVNDYEVADLWPNAARVLFGAGPRRLASLIWRRGQEKRAVRSATRVVCNSDYTRQAVLRAYGGDPARTLTIHKAVEVGEKSGLAPFSPAKNKTVPPGDQSIEQTERGSGTVQGENGACPIFPGLPRANGEKRDRRHFSLASTSPAVQDADRGSSSLADFAAGTGKMAPVPVFRLAFVGTNWRIKGLDVLLHALARLGESDVKFSLVVAGSADLPGHAPMVRLAGRLGLGDRVTFAGRLGRADLARLLWASDAVVLPSRQEAFGVAVLEALAAGVPVIASRVGGIPEILRDGREGLLVPVGDARALAAAIAKLAHDPSLRARLASAGPARAADFSLRRMIEAYRGLYRELSR